MSHQDADSPNSASILSRYLHTDAGAEAADLLATHFMDEGDFRTAARYYGLLLTRAGGADALAPDVLFRAAYAFRQTGDKAHEDLVWQSVRSRGIHEIKFGDDIHAVGELQDYLAGIAPPADVAAQQWNYYIGDAAAPAAATAAPPSCGANGPTHRFLLHVSVADPTETWSSTSG